MATSNFECTSCGACCATYRVSFYWSDGAHLPERMVEQVTPTMACMAGTYGPSPRCAALQGAVGERVRCAVYEQRPPVCRDVVPGDARCVEARRRHGLPAQICFDDEGRQPGPARPVPTVGRLVELVPLIDAILRAK